MHWLDAEGLRPSGRVTRVRATHFVLSGGAINSPALLLRSNAPDPHRLTGARTFLHPVVVSAATFEQRVDGFSGAADHDSDHFLDGQPIDGPIGPTSSKPRRSILVLFATTLHSVGSSTPGR